MELELTFQASTLAPDPGIQKVWIQVCVGRIFSNGKSISGFFSVVEVSMQISR